MNRGSGRRVTHAAPVAPERGRNAHIATFNNERGHSGRTDCGAMETTGEDRAALMSGDAEAVVVVEGKKEGEERREGGRKGRRRRSLRFGLIVGEGAETERILICPKGRGGKARQRDGTWDG